MKFLIVEAFTETLFGGNPAGVVFIPEGEDFLLDDPEEISPPASSSEEKL